MNVLSDFFSTAWIPWLILVAVFSVGVFWGVFKRDNATKKDITKSIKGCQTIQNEKIIEISRAREAVWQDVKETRIMVMSLSDGISEISGYLQHNGFKPKG